MIGREVGFGLKVDNYTVHSLILLNMYLRLLFSFVFLFFEVMGEQEVKKGLT